MQLHRQLRNTLLAMLFVMWTFCGHSFADEEGPNTVGSGITKDVVVLHGFLASTLQITHSHTDWWGKHYAASHEIWEPMTSVFDYYGPLHNFYLLNCDANGDSVEANITPVASSSNKLMDSFYGGMIDALRSDGYNVHPFCYDWRLDANVNVEKLAEFINDLGVEKVSLVGHSLGGIISTKYISDSLEATGCNCKVDKFIAIGTPFLGAPCIVDRFENAVVMGDETDILSRLTAYVMTDEVKTLLKNIAPCYQLLPNKKYFEYIDSPYIEKSVSMSIFTRTLQPICTFDGVKNFLKTRSWTNGRLLDAADDFNDSINLPKTLNSVDSYLVVGIGGQTISKVEMRTNFPQVCAATEYTNGDFTVPAYSAAAGYVVPPERIYYVNSPHTTMAINSGVVAQTLNILSGKPKTLANGVSRVTPPCAIAKSAATKG